MRQSLRRHAMSYTLAIGIALPLAGKRARADDGAADIGVVLAAIGKPVLQDTSGRTAASAVLQPLHEDDVMSFGAGDSVTICEDALGTATMIAGPGTVRLTRTGIVSVTGSPAIRAAGACDGGIAGNANGGVLLRRFARDPPR